MDLAASDAEGALRGVRLCVPEGDIVQAGFFDDEELAVVFQLRGERYLATTTVEALSEQLVDLPTVKENLGSLVCRSLATCADLSSTRTSTRRSLRLRAAVLSALPGHRPTRGCLR